MRSINEHEQRAVRRIAAVRRHLEISQKQMGDAIGMSRAGVSAVECGRKHLRFAAAVAMCRVLDLDLSAVAADAPLVLEKVETERFE